MKAIKKSGNYRLYRVDGHLELWLGTRSNTGDYSTGVIVGYVSDAENFEYAVDMAREEMRYLMAEGA